MVLNGLYQMQNNEMYTLSILSTNDIHGNLDRMAQYLTIIKKVRSEAGNTLLLDGGDLFKRRNLQKFQVETELDILQKMNYNAMVLGNNDFNVFPVGVKINSGNNNRLNRLNRYAKLPILCANVKMKDTGKYIQNVKPYKILNVNGVKVGIIGVTSVKPQVTKWNIAADKEFVRGDIVVKELIPEVSKKSDINIVLSHTGYDVDQLIAKIKGVSAVIGADDHFMFTEPQVIKTRGRKVPITQNGGEENHHLGRLDLVFKQFSGGMKLIDFGGKLYNLDGVKNDPEVLRVIEKYRAFTNNAAA